MGEWGTERLNRASMSETDHYPSRSKCPESLSDDDCHKQCILPYLMKFCHDLRPQPGAELDCEKVLACVNGFLDKVECQS